MRVKVRQYQRMRAKWKLQRPLQEDKVINGRPLYEGKLFIRKNGHIIRTCQRGLLLGRLTRGLPHVPRGTLNGVALGEILYCLTLVTMNAGSTAFGCMANSLGNVYSRQWTVFFQGCRQNTSNWATYF